MVGDPIVDSLEEVVGPFSSSQPEANDSHNMSQQQQEEYERRVRDDTTSYDTTTHSFILPSSLWEDKQSLSSYTKQYKQKKHNNNKWLTFLLCHDTSEIDWSYYQQLVILLVCLFSMGSALGFERSLLPRMATSIFHEQSSATIMGFVSSFGAAKAVANIVAGPLADRYGRKPTLIAGFVLGLPVMPFINFATSWRQVTIMNIAFGVSQGLIGSSLFFLLIDVMGPQKRGIAVGMGECVIYVSTALINVLAGNLASRFGFRPVPFWVATAFAVLGLVSTIPLKDTLDQVKEEQSLCESSHGSSTSSISRKNKKGVLSMEDRSDSNVSEISAVEGGIASRKTRPAAAIMVDGQTNDVSELNEQTPLLLKTAAVDEAFPLLSTSTSSSLEEFDEDSVDEMADIMEEGTFATSAMRTPCTPRRSQDVNVSFAEHDRVYRYIVEEEDDDDDDDDDRPMEGMGMEETSTVVDHVLTFLGSQTGMNFMILCLGGMAMNFKDGFAWGSFPLFFSEYHKLRDHNTDILVAVYPLCWGFAQAFTGALSDLYGRKLFLTAGAMSCTLAMALYTVPGIVWGRPAGGSVIIEDGGDAAAAADGDHIGSRRHVIVWIVADVLLGIGTAMSYPALQAGVADEINPINRGVGLGFYRFIRDMGYVVGALICGRLTDAIGYMDTFLVVTAVLGMSLLSIIFLYSPVHWSENVWSVRR